VLAILAYVTLDLSMASMPGAFVFDAAQSVESPHSGRGRDAGDVVIHLPAGAGARVALPARDVARPAPVIAAHGPRERGAPRCPARAALDTASPSDDRH
jgi:hypothetical protein